MLANLYLHYVLDLWVEQRRRKQARGDVIIVRYADDAVLGFEHRVEAERFWEELRERLGKFGLEVHSEKARLIEFGRFAAAPPSPHSCLDGGGAVCHTTGRKDAMTDEMKGLVDKAASARKAAGAKEVCVFGSASKGKMRPNSDVDIAVSGLPPEVLFRAMAAAHDALGCPLDLVDLDEDNAFTRYLKSKGELLRMG